MRVAIMPNTQNQPTIYQSNDDETYKGFKLARGKDNLLTITKDGEVVESLGKHTGFNSAKAVIDRDIAQSVIPDTIAIENHGSN
jgi:hypothetical protein